MTKDTKLKFIVNIVFYCIWLLIIYFTVRFSLAYLFPVLIGIVVTVSVQRPAKFISEKLRIKKGICALILVILIYIVLCLICGAIVYSVSSYLTGLAGDAAISTQIGEMYSTVTKQLGSLLSKLPDNLKGAFSSWFSKLSENVIGYLSTFTQTIIKGVPMFLTGGIVTVVASCYIAKDYDGFKASILSVMSNKIKDVVGKVVLIFKNSFLKIVLGYIKLLFITFAELTLGLMLLGVERSLAVAAVIAVLDMLPIIGTGTVLIPWAAFSLLSGNVFLGVGLAMVYAIIMIVRNIIEPRIIGKQIGLHPLISLIAVFVGLKLFGIVGLFLMPVIFTLIYKMYEQGIFDPALSSKS